MALLEIDVFSRRYFEPALSGLAWLSRHQPTPVADDVCPRLLCLPIYDALELEQVSRICDVVRRALA